MRIKPYCALLMSVVVVILATAPLFGQAKRVALVIGNSAYAKIQSLNNPVNDAVDMTAALQRLGFTVLTKTDADRKTMRTVIDDFNKAIKGAEVAFFYYSGHGVQLDNENYLVPVGAEVSVAGDVQDECVSLSRITARMNEAGARTNIIILDACRDNPFKAVTRGIERGLAVIVQKPPESIIVYATAENEKAEDGGGRNGTFTSALLKNIQRPESFMDILTDVNAQVRKETSEKQKPAMYASLSHRVYLAGSGSTPAPAVTPEKKPSLTVEKAYGSVTVEVRTGGTLYLNSTAMGQLTPGSSARLDGIEAGQADLEMRYANGRSETLTADVSKNALTAVSFTYVERPKVPENMIRVEGGTFQMGDTFGDGKPYETPVHSVMVSSFLIAKYVVTQKEWREVMGTDPSTFKGDDLPVESVTWHDSVQYCNKLSAKNGLDLCYTINETNVTCDFSKNGFRLPTEAEWEFAAKGGTQSRGTKYAGSNSPDNVAWYGPNSGNKTHPVGQKQANELGLYDMGGDVWEWCNDWFGGYGPSAQMDPQGVDTPTMVSDNINSLMLTPAGPCRILRGGSFNSEASSVRAANRNFLGPAGRNGGSGFRVVCRPE